MSEINGIEFEDLVSIAQILLKGNPETQIARLFCDKEYSLTYVIEFISKLNISAEWEHKIMNAYMDMTDENIKWYEKPDKAQHLGDSLRRSAFYAPRTKTYV